HTRFSRDWSSDVCSSDLDRETGEVQAFISGTGGASRPVMSRDGRTLAFIRRDGPRSVLFLYDMDSGRQRPLFDRLDHDQQEAWAIFGTYPGFSWTPDNKHIVVWAGAKIWKVSVEARDA